MTEPHPLDPPSPFIQQWIIRLAQTSRPGRALDVAMGRGRHAAVLAENGWATYGVDVKLDVVRSAHDLLARRGLTLRAWCADLTMPALPAACFDLVVVARYLQRDLFPSLVGALRPSGIILYETFTEDQRAHGRGPTSADHLLMPGELARAFDGMERLFYEEVIEPEALARLAARKRPRSS